MNNKITFPELIEAISIATNTSKRVSETFLKELFTVITETLESGENVKIKNLGIFKVVNVDARKSINVNTGAEIEIPAHKKVSFVPDKSMAEAVNMPFEGFETVILEDDISEDDIKKLSDLESEPLNMEETDSNVAENDIAEVDIPTEKLKDEEDDGASENVQIEKGNVVVPPPFNPDRDDDNKEESALGDNVEPYVIAGEESPNEDMAKAEEELQSDDNNSYFDDNPKAEGTSRLQSQSEATQEYYYDDEEDENTHKKHFTKGFLWGFVAALIVCAAVGYCYYSLYLLPKLGVPQIVQTSITGNSIIVDNDSATVVKEQRQDTVAQVKAETIKVEDKVVTDTVTRKNYLAQMAKHHYGKAQFWVYIYEENKAKISNPNTVAPGTVVVIPPASKYGIDKTSKASLDKAQEKAYEILKQFE